MYGISKLGKESKEWCKRAKTVMVAKEMKGTELATACGYTPQYISTILNGNYYSAEAVSRISAVLGIRSY